MGKEGSGVTCLRRDLNKCPRALGSCGSAWRLGSACWDCTGLELEVASRSGAFPLPHPSSSTEGSGTQGGPLFRASCYPRPLIYLTSEPAFASPPRIARSHRGRDFRVPLWSGPFQSSFVEAGCSCRDSPSCSAQISRGTSYWRGKGDSQAASRAVQLPGFPSSPFGNTI